MPSHHRPGLCPPTSPQASPARSTGTSVRFGTIQHLLPQQATHASEAASPPSRAGSQGGVDVRPWEVHFSELAFKHVIGGGSFGTASRRGYRTWFFKRFE